MSLVELEQLQSAIRDIADFPKPGIIFKDITPILGDGKLFRSVIDHLAGEAEKANPTKVVGIDARGFLFGAAVAYKLGVGCVPIRKKGKLPYKTIGSSYRLEYGDAEVEMHVDAIAAAYMQGRGARKELKGVDGAHSGDQPERSSGRKSEE